MLRRPWLANPDVRHALPTLGMYKSGSKGNTLLVLPDFYNPWNITVLRFHRVTDENLEISTDFELESQINHKDV